MAYEPINWDYDKEISPKNLKHMDDGIYDNSLNIDKKTNDTGWINIVPTEGTAGTGYYAPKYRKIGNVVYLKGGISGIKNKGAVIFTLPEGFRDTQSRMSFCCTNDQLQIVMVRINDVGYIYVQGTTGDFNQGVNVFLDGISFPVTKTE